MSLQQENPEAVTGDNALRLPARWLCAPAWAGGLPTPSRRCGRRPPRRRSWHHLPPGERRAAGAPVGSIDARDCVCRNDVLVDVPPGKDDERRVGAQSGQADHPPDVPDQRETHNSREERAHEAGWAVPWHLDLRIGGFFAEPRLLEGPLLHAPVGVFALDIREHGEVEGWRRGRCRPFEGAPVPGIAGLVTKPLTPSDADSELRNLQAYA